MWDFEVFKYAVNVSWYYKSSVLNDNGSNCDKVLDNWLKYFKVKESLWSHFKMYWVMP